MKSPRALQITSVLSANSSRTTQSAELTDH